MKKKKRVTFPCVIVLKSLGVVNCFIGPLISSLLGLWIRLFVCVCVWVLSVTLVLPLHLLLDSRYPQLFVLYYYYYSLGFV